MEPPQDPFSGTEPSAPAADPDPLIPEHELIRCIARGGYGEVWLARTVIGTYRAVKIVYRRRFDHERPYEREFQGLVKFEPISRRHEGLMDVLQIGRSEEHGYFYSVLELADDRVTGREIVPNSYRPRTLGDVVAVRQTLPFDQCLTTMLALSAAVAHLHENGLIHRDIKPWNVIYVNGALKLADFGLVTDANSQSIGGGTIGYLAPEGTPSPQADVYSLGKVLYEISTGKDRQEFPELPTFYAAQEDRAKLGELNEIILKACDKNPAKRYQSASEFHAELMLLNAGKSVKRLRHLERRVALLTRIGLAALVVLLLGAAGFYRVNQERKKDARRLADSYVATGIRLANQGDLFGAMGMYAEALKLDQDDEREQRDRRLISTTLPQCPKLLQLLFAEQEIRHVDFAPDGQTLVAAGANGGLTSWEVSSGRAIHTWPQQTSKINGVDHSPDGRFLLTAGEDGMARLWDAATRQLVREFPHSKPVLSACFNREGNAMVTASGDQIVRVWTIDGELRQQLSGHSNRLTSAEFSPDGRRIVSSSWDATAIIWNLDSGLAESELLHPPLTGYPNFIHCASFSPDGQFVVTAAADGYARLWEVNTGRPQSYSFKHPASVSSAKFSPDGRYILTACSDHGARIWYSHKPVEVTPLMKHNSFLHHADFSPDGRLVATAGSSGLGVIWNVSVAPQWTPPPEFFPRAGSNSATVLGNVVQLRHAADARALSSPLVASNPVHEVKFNSDGSRLAVVSREAAPDGSIRQFVQISTAEGSFQSPPFACSNWVIGLSRDGHRLAVTSSLGKGSNFVQVWNTVLGMPLTSPLRHVEEGWRAALNADGTRLATFDSTNALLWDAGNGTLVATLPHPGKVSHAEFSLDGRRLVTCFNLTGGAAQVWDSSTGEPIGSAFQHDLTVNHATFSPDGTRVATASDDRTVVLWTVGSKIHLRRFSHQEKVMEANISQDGRWIVTVCDDNSVRIWDMETGAQLMGPMRHPWMTWHARFVGNGHRLVVKRLKGDLWAKEPSAKPFLWEWTTWDLSPDPRPVEDVLLLSRLVSGHSSEPLGDTIPLDNRTMNSLWDLLRARHPAAFTVPTGDEIRWHLRETQAAENRDRWFAAAFHLERLCRLQPSDSSLRARLTRAEENLKSVVGNGNR